MSSQNRCILTSRVLSFNDGFNNNTCYIIICTLFNYDSPTMVMLFLGSTTLLNFKKSYLWRKFPVMKITWLAMKCIPYIWECGNHWSIWRDAIRCQSWKSKPEKILYNSYLSIASFQLFSRDYFVPVRHPLSILRFIPRACKDMYRYAPAS